jgi:hypothetical protein
MIRQPHVSAHLVKRLLVFSLLQLSIEIDELRPWEAVSLVLDIDRLPYEFE